jgi:hypothetical protein
LPIRYRKPIAETVSPSLSIDLHIANASSVDVDLTRDAGTAYPNTPPVTANIYTLQSGFTININPDALIGVGGSTEGTHYRWYNVDVSAGNFLVVKDQVYCIIVRQASTLNTGSSYQWLGKYCIKDEASPFTFGFENRSIYQDITQGVAISTISAANWLCLSGTLEYVQMIEVVVKKTKQDLKSVNVIDTENSKYTPGFTSILGGDDTTISVKSPDFSTAYVRGTDYSIDIWGGQIFINLDSFALEDTIIVQWYESEDDLLIMSDALGNAIIKSDSLSHGDEELFLKVAVTGERMWPSDNSVELNKQFTLLPGLDEELVSDNNQSQRMEVTTIESWNEQSGKFDEISGVEDTSKFAVEFRDPFVIGTTSYSVRTGKGLSTDRIIAGTKGIGSKDVPFFYEIDVSSASFPNDLYHVMLKQEEYLEWRVATGNDFSDMQNGDFVDGTPPTSPSDVKTSDHFYLKHMNAKFGMVLAHWIAYESEARIYFVNEDGVVIRDDSFVSEDARNPLNTAYKSKRISVSLNPVDLQGNPLFEAHGDSGETGYDSLYDTDVKHYMSTRIKKVLIAANGLSATFDNYGDENSFLDVKVVGFPVSKVLNIRNEIRNPGYEHADAKELNISNPVLQHQSLVDRLTRSLNEFYNTYRINYIVNAVYHPLLRPGRIVRVVSSKEGFDHDLFVITNPRHKIMFSSEDGFTTAFKGLLQI